MQNPYLINGKSEGCLTPLDRGLSYGDGVFRTIPVRQGVPASWQRHYRKLADDCNVLGITCPGEALLLSDIERLFSSQADAVAKIMITRGEGARGYAVPHAAQPTRIVMSSPFPAYPEAFISDGVQLHLCRLRLASQPRLAGIKHLNRLENVLARMEWSDSTIADGVLLDQAGHVIECTMSNIFIRRGQRLITPDLRECGVAGVTRDRILELSPRLGLESTIAAFDYEELLFSDEMVICNSLIGAWQVRQLAGHRWNAGTLAQDLQELLKE